MKPEEFKRLVDECRTEMEVRRVFHWHFAAVSGTLAQLQDCIAYADARAETLGEDGAELGARGCAGLEVAA